VPIKPERAAVATSAANKPTTATRPQPTVKFFNGFPPASSAWTKTQMAVTTLKMAPISNASMTPMPTARPARGYRTHGRSGCGLTTAARAR